MDAGSFMVLPMAVVADLVLGDPVGWPHPVRWMGIAIERLEAFVRRTVANEFMAGLLFCLGLSTAAWLVTWLVVGAATSVHPVLGTMVEIVFVYWAISIHSLKAAAMDVYRVLLAGDIASARRAVAMIVGRDTRNLDEIGISRAAVETVAENLVDGVISPMFFAALGGAPAAMAFKMVSTLDSMIGYRNDRYERFGKASARLDDIFNFIPARLSLVVIAIAAKILAGRGQHALMTALADGGKHRSPNAGRPEAAFSGALGIRLGGPNTYHGCLVEKPTIGESFRDPDPGHIPRSCSLMVMSALLFLPVAILIHTLV